MADQGNGQLSSYIMETMRNLQSSLDHIREGVSEQNVSRTALGVRMDQVTRDLTKLEEYEKRIRALESITSLQEHDKKKLQRWIYALGMLALGLLFQQLTSFLGLTK